MSDDSKSHLSKTVRVASVQAESIPFDLHANVKKAAGFISEAAQKGAKLIAFAECFIPGYPYWIWARPVDADMVNRYIAASLQINSPEMRHIQSVAKENDIAVSLGFTERDNQSLYIAQALIGADGEIKITRRKIKPTHMERTIFGEGSGSSLQNVVDVPGVGKVGGLTCWEHTQPLLRYHTYSLGEEIHVAAWPPMQPFVEGKNLSCCVEDGTKTLTSTHSIEGGCFSLYVTSIISELTINSMDLAKAALFEVPGGGKNMVFGPDGSRIESNVLGEHEEGLVIADLAFERITRVKHFLDTSGHYSRPDLLWLGVDTTEKKHVRYSGA